MWRVGITATVVAVYELLLLVGCVVAAYPGDDSKWSKSVSGFYGMMALNGLWAVPVLVGLYFSWWYWPNWKHYINRIT